MLFLVKAKWTEYAGKEKALRLVDAASEIEARKKMADAYGLEFFDCDSPDTVYKAKDKKHWHWAEISATGVL